MSEAAQTPTDQFMSLPALIRQHSARFLEKLAVTDGETHLSYAVLTMPWIALPPRSGGME